MTKTEQKVLKVLSEGGMFAVTSTVQARIVARMVDARKCGLVQNPRKYAFQTTYAVSIPNNLIESGKFRYVSLARFMMDWGVDDTGFKTVINHATFKANLLRGIK